MQMSYQEDETLTGTWKRQDSSPTARNATLKYIALGLLLVSLLAALSAAIGLAVRLHAVEHSCPPPSECLHALGGGPVSPGGSLKGASPGYCHLLLAAYADPASGAYWREVELAAEGAMQVFFSNNSLSANQQHEEGQQQAGPAPRMFTQRSLLLQLQQPQQAAAAAADSGSTQLQGAGSSSIGSDGVSSLQLGGPQLQASPSAAFASVANPLPAPDRALVVVFDIDETVLSNMQQILHPDQWPWDKWVQAAAAPPLLPVLRFYKALCAAGYSVAFVTGRRETQRQHTMDNLAAAGYGGLCQPNRQPGAGGAGAGDSSSTGGSSDRECCFEALYLRPLNDTRLASVYKPWARKDLLSRGFKLLALVGDQFSDINGDASAPFAFKLPNPFYYIL